MWIDDMKECLNNKTKMKAFYKAKDVYEVDDFKDTLSFEFDLRYK